MHADAARENTVKKQCKLDSGREACRRHCMKEDHQGQMPKMGTISEFSPDFKETIPPQFFLLIQICRDKKNREKQLFKDIQFSNL